MEDLRKEVLRLRVRASFLLERAPTLLQAEVESLKHRIA